MTESVVKELTATIRRIAESFGCSVNNVTIEFSMHHSETWWSITVKTPPRDRRFRHDDVTCGLGRTLRSAEQEVLDHRETHDFKSKARSRRRA